MSGYHSEFFLIISAYHCARVPHISYRFIVLGIKEDSTYANLYLLMKYGLRAENNGYCVLTWVEQLPLATADNF